MNFALFKKNAILVTFLLLELAVLAGWAPVSLWFLGIRILLALLSLFFVLLAFRRRDAEGKAEVPQAPFEAFSASTSVRICPLAGAREMALLYHEIRNCTSTLKGNAILLKQGLPADADLAPVERIERVAASIERIAREVMELGDPGLPAAAKKRLRLDSLLGECVEDYFPTHREAFRFDCAEGLPAIEGDAGKLRQAFVNVIKNALEAGAGTVVLRAFRRSESLSVIVEDDGKGCAPGELARIFLPMHTSKRASGGLGLGLALVKTYIEQHGGQVWAASRMEKGVPVRGMAIHMSFPLLQDMAGSPPEGKVRMDLPQQTAA
jgi:signal transduction histidine kinase